MRYIALFVNEILDAHSCSLKPVLLIYSLVYLFKSLEFLSLSLSHPSLEVTLLLFVESCHVQCEVVLIIIAIVLLNTLYYDVKHLIVIFLSLISAITLLFFVERIGVPIQILEELSPPLNVSIPKVEQIKDRGYQLVLSPYSYLASNYGHIFMYGELLLLFVCSCWLFLYC